VIFRWRDVPLLRAQETLLAKLLAGLSYFGRSESLCQAELIEPEDPVAGIGWCLPSEGRRISAHIRDVFCPDPASFRITDLWARRTDPKIDSSDAPKHLIDALLSTDMKGDGAKWISYVMPEDWPSKRLVRTPITSHQPPKPSSVGPRIAHYLWFSLQCRVPVQPKFTVPLAEQFRRAACSHFFNGGQTSFALFGHQRRFSLHRRLMRFAICVHLCSSVFISG
jgi:hypothetical protein